jgi:acyl-CoA dehydrogenase
VEIVHSIPHIGGGPRGTSHAEIRYDGVRVPEEHLLGTENEGFTNVQQRLGPARLTHCMRYAGMARRSLDIAAAYAADPEAFDAAMQLVGGNAIAHDLPLADFYTTARQFRFVDGADEVHNRVIAREAFADPSTEELEPLTRYDAK